MFTVNFMFGLFKSNPWRLESISCNRNELKQCINTRQITKMSNSTWQHMDNSGYHGDPWPIKICHSNDDLTAQLYLKFLHITQHEVPFISTSEAQALQAQNTWCMRQLVYIENCVGKSPIVEKNCVSNYLIWIKVLLPLIYRELVSCADFKATTSVPPRNCQNEKPS